MTAGSMAELAKPDDAARILLVDDDPTNLRVLFETLRGKGYKLLTAKSGADALKIIRGSRPELVLLDIMMPGMDGYEVCEQVRADPEIKDVPILLLSALDDSDSKVRGFEAGAVDYVSKPFHPGEVIARVKTHLTVHRLQRRLAEANQRMRRDLDAAAKIQRGLLPQILPAAPAVQFAWSYRPCDELAGDSLNVYRIDEHHIGLYVLDVCGHGVPSALLSVAVTRSLTPRSDSTSIVMEQGPDGRMRVSSAADVVRHLNAMYPMDSDSPLYFTIVYGVIDLRTGHFRFASAGHPGPLVFPKQGNPHRLEATGIPVGIIADTEFEETNVVLSPGDRFYLYSDGVYEERNLNGEQFGFERLEARMSMGAAVTLAQSVDRVLEDVVAWSGRDELTDDAAVLAVEWIGVDQ